MSSDDNLPTNINNQINVPCTDVILACASWQNQRDQYFQLNSTSPAIGVGEGGSDVGCTDGNLPYVFYGFPQIPRLTHLFVQGISTQNTLQVNVRATSQN
jgi:hypothetical protein